MEERSREELEAVEHEEMQDVYVPRTKFQRALAWIALAVVLFGLAGTIYWMMVFKP